MPRAISSCKRGVYCLACVWSHLNQEETFFNNPMRQRDSGNRTGRNGEEAAVRFLAAQGYVILARNCRLPSGEIDIIARDGDCLVFVEVKTRRSQQFGSPFEAVNSRKQQRLTAAALEYMAEHHLDMPSRFDVAAVVPEKGAFRVELLTNAFECASLASLY
ncbi:YraN family protein [Candidatus Electronema sp. PJ]|uniref:YraN family protein n=1 Tax=Candidatus Electronema sp. PJ TaxID=3401572 RepID=UPI003AA8C070